MPQFTPFDKNLHGHLFPTNGDFRCVELTDDDGFGEPIVPSNITKDDVVNAIKQCNVSSATGLSGLSFDHIKRVEHSEQFLNGMKHLIDTLLQDPTQIARVPKLYEVKVILIPKADNKVRPIQITEAILRLFHRVLLNKLSPGVMEKILSPQVVNRPNQFLHAAAKIKKLHEKGPCHFMQLDIKNAFNSVPHAVIRNGLKMIRVQDEYVNYIMAMLANRTANVDVSLERGVP